MKALVADRYGDSEVLRMDELPDPQPANDELLIRVSASTVNRTDTGILSGKPFFARLVFGFSRPHRQIPGTEFAGIVERVGAARTDFQPGDRVFGFHDEGCCAHAEYLVAGKREALARVPAQISLQDAAACSEGPFYAQNYLRCIKLAPGARVLINGISGSIGTAMLQLAKAQGATVVGVCPGDATDAVLERGADTVYDHAITDYRTHETERFDFILDTVGNQSYLDCCNALTDAGTYASSELGRWCQNVMFALRPRVLSQKRAIFPIPRNVQACQTQLLGLLEAGSYRPVIDRKFGFDDIVEAYRYVARGRKTGNVVIDFESGT